MYFLSATFLIIVFIYLMYFCATIVINNARVRRELFYHYNYIPDTLLNTVRVHKLK
ncbi:pif-7 [Cyclophragma undans nucleopolyhedrovirus]|uniref:Pif-7 n=2 Tax=Alphabaculovirus TaxID=558016 RepID=A0A288QVX4_9ABAC|nr:pif-7 [Cyclophragma undans nucleopolyhedrovirus]AFS51927.1 DekiORF49 [Dendrolimus kikuchii nucleopolyhedrovirus]AOT85519.1 pif-7 [Cyclophragma undans nucleopolyhedrovirus]